MTLKKGNSLQLMGMKNGKHRLSGKKPQTSMVDKIVYYLKRDGKRERIRKAGHERCLQEHTWRRRFQMAFQEMGLV